MTDRPGLDFSFSGLKTFAANTIRSNGDDEQTRADIARAFEDAVVDTLMIKCRRALEQTGFKRLVMAGERERQPYPAGEAGGDDAKTRRRGVLRSP